MIKTSEKYLHPNFKLMLRYESAVRFAIIRQCDWYIQTISVYNKFFGL